jgi:hypothetical protein
MVYAINRLYLPHQLGLLEFGEREKLIVINRSGHEELADQVVVGEQLIDAVEAELLAMGRREEVRVQIDSLHL